MPDFSGLTIPDEELDFELVRRASGPGGQNVNKVATAVRLRFDVRGSRALSEEVREKLARLAGRRVTRDGVLVITAQRFRNQEGNRRDALSRLADLLARAAEPDRPRVATRPGRAARERRLESKRRRAERKAGRRGAGEGE